MGQRERGARWPLLLVVGRSARFHLHLPPHLHSSGTWLTHTLAFPYNDSPAFQVLSTLVAFFPHFTQKALCLGLSPLEVKQSYVKESENHFRESESVHRVKSPVNRVLVIVQSQIL